MVGKTALLTRHSTREFPPYRDEHFWSWSARMIHNGHEFTYAPWEGSGSPKYAKQRPLGYPCSTAFIICFSVMNRASFDNVKTIYLPELQKFDKTIPIILVGNLCDQREDSNVMQQVIAGGHQLVSQEDGEKLAQEISALKYFESSALRDEGVDELFTFLWEVGIERESPKPNTTKGKCDIM